MVVKLGEDVSHYNGMIQKLLDDIDTLLFKSPDKRLRKDLLILADRNRDMINRFRNYADTEAKNERDTTRARFVHKMRESKNGYGERR
jgi:hypothetical protein